MTPYQKAGQKAIKEFFEDHSDIESLHLWLLSEKADTAARKMGMKKIELYPSIYNYECLLPKGTKTGQVGDMSNSMYSAFNPYYAGKSADVIVIPMPGVFDLGVDTYSNC
jgi:hypothetical protein